jgi:hypothetical protein
MNNESNAEFLRRVDDALEQTAIDGIVSEASLLIWEAKRRGHTAAYFPLCAKIAQCDPPPYHKTVTKALRDIGIYTVSENISGYPDLICYKDRRCHGSNNIYFQQRWAKLLVSFGYALPVMALLSVITLWPVLGSFICPHDGPLCGAHFYQCGFFAWAVWGWKWIAVIGATITAAVYWFKYKPNKDGRR